MMIMRRKDEVDRENANYLTSQGTKAKWVQEASSTDFADMSYTFSRFWLRPLVQK